MSVETDRFEASMKARRNRLIEAVRPALEKGANELQASMKSLAPKDTNALSETIVITPPGEQTPAYSTGGRRTAGEHEVLITAGGQVNGHDVRYAHLQEFGSVHNQPQAFFYLSLRLLKKRVQARIKRALRKAIKLEAGDA